MLANAGSRLTAGFDARGRSLGSCPRVQGTLPCRPSTRPGVSSAYRSLHCRPFHPITLRCALTQSLPSNWTIHHCTPYLGLGPKGRLDLLSISAEIVEESVSELGKPFTVVMYGNGDRGLRDADSGQPIPYWNDLLPWLDGVIE